MKRKLKELLNKFRLNPFFRLLIYPYVLYKTGKEIRDYQKGTDARYIKKTKGIYEGKRCFIVGNGPSLSIEDLEIIKDEYSFASNGIVKLFDKTKWRPNWYMVVDDFIIEQLWDWDKEIFTGIESYVYDKEFVEKHRQEFNIHYMVRGGKYAITPEKQFMEKPSEDVSKFFSRSQSVTTSLIELAMYLGFSEIYLLGIDHSFPIEVDASGKKNYNSQAVHHFAGYSGKIRKIAYIDAITQAYKSISKYAKELGIEIRNCTRGGNLEVFKRCNLEELFISDESKT